MSEFEKESHEEEPKASDPTTTRNWPVWLVLAVVSSLVLAAAAAWLLYFHQEQKRKVALDYQHSFLAFTEETQEFLNNALAAFAKVPNTVSDSRIKNDESAIDSSIYYTLDEKEKCPLHVEKDKVVYEFSGFSENDDNGWDNQLMKWSADPSEQFKSYSASKPLLLLITDERGEIVLSAGRSTIFPPQHQLAEWIKQSRGQEKKPDGQSEEAPFMMDGQEYNVLHREVRVPPILRDQLQLPKDSCPPDLLHVFGLVSTDQIFRDSLELSRGPLIVLCFALFLLVLSFPFLKLFFAPEERFRRIDAVLLLLCGALLAATVVFSGILGASLTSLRKQDDLQIEKVSKKFAHKLEKNEKQWLSKEPKPILLKANLPWGMGFAILDKETLPLGHSGSLHTAFEEITSMSSQGKLLRGALRSGSKKPFTILSMGRPERVQIVPITLPDPMGRPDRPKTSANTSPGAKLLVFRDQEPIQSIRFYTSLVTLLVTTSCILLLVTLGTLLSRLVQPPSYLTFLWLNRSDGSLYLCLALAYLLLGVLVLSTTLLGQSPWDTVLAAVLVPAIAVPWSLWALTGRPKLIKPLLRPVAWIFSLVFVAILIWICFEAFPKTWWPLLLVTPISLEVAFRLRGGSIPPRYGLSLYSLAILSFLLLSAGLPTFAVYRAAFLEEGRLLARSSFRLRSANIR
ncbi:MAG TPA: hypothetical protein VGS07_21915 [Thermoanaerobaculia bacterium]|jgi:hypothetical protein|nr:hypothetical protein [Thermoanaerobaculia bacterium]